MPDHAATFVLSLHLCLRVLKLRSFCSFNLESNDIGYTKATLTYARRGLRIRARSLYQNYGLNYYQWEWQGKYVLRSNISGVRSGCYTKFVSM